MSEKLNALKKKLVEIFQLDQTDLDFGIYRIMNQKADEIQRFLDEKLLPQVQDSFMQFKSDGQTAIQDELNKLVDALKQAGMNPDDAPKVKELKEKLSGAIDIHALENEVFSHLTSFFSRYYEGGDFLSLRRYKKDVYAIPYEGEEVKLHWANADQYYIKSSENFRDYSFKIANGKTVHFKLIDAETEKDNNKTQKDKERRFIIDKDNPLYVENDELYIRFHYIADDSKKKQDKLNEDAVAVIAGLITKSYFNQFIDVLVPQPTEKNKKRTVLEKHLNDYTAKNSFDYFIHKDLGGFLRRELDFYIKNEVIFLDDLDEDNVKLSLGKAKTIKVIAQKIIDFLEQLENFQKKIWLKKKFVVGSGYCITLDNVPEELYSEIVTNKKQIAEWESLFSISDIEGDTLSVSGSVLLDENGEKSKKVAFLKQNPFLVLDTKFFNADFNEKLLASITNLDEKTDGLLINADNFHGLNLLQEKYKEKVKCTYIDPPYNTGDDGFAYKDNYKSSSWLTMQNQLTVLVRQIMSSDSSFYASCDENEALDYGFLLKQIFGKENHIESITWNKRIPKNDKGIGNIHEYIYLFTKNSGLRNLQTNPFIMRKSGIDEILELVSKLKSKGIPIQEAQQELKKYYKKNDYDRGITLYCELTPQYKLWGKINMSWPNAKTEGPRYEVVNPVTQKPTPIPNRGWRWKEETFRNAENEGPLIPLPDGSVIKGRIWYPNDTKTQPSSVTYLEEVQSFLLRSILSLKSDGGVCLENLGLEGQLDYPKPPKLMEWIYYSNNSSSGLYLDYFAGSGTSGEALINLNREDGGNRKYILIEMGEYFDQVTKPRIQKVVYSDDWKDGKPVSRNGSSHIFKYMTLESYEDALNNLKPKESKNAIDALVSADENVQEQYMLSYMMDFEYKHSLLNLDMFTHPFDYQMTISNGTETKQVNVNLVETFNYLIGLYVKNIYSSNGFKVVEGETRAEEKTLIIWRDLKEKDNATLDELFNKLRVNPKDFEFDRIYVNGDNNLENLKLDNETWKVTLIEEEFKRRMFDVEDV
jgi:adenine-specific DNA-methyltransferase